MILIIKEILFIFSLTSLYLLFICSITRHPLYFYFFIFFFKIFNKNKKYRLYIGDISPIYWRYFRFFLEFSINQLVTLYIISIDTGTRHIDDILLIYRDIFNTDPSTCDRYFDLQAAGRGWVLFYHVVNSLFFKSNAS